MPDSLSLAELAWKDYCRTPLIPTKQAFTEIFTRAIANERNRIDIKAIYSEGFEAGKWAGAGLEREACANTRPPRSAGNPPDGKWSGWYEVGWNNAVVAYDTAIRARSKDARQTPESPK